MILGLCRAEIVQFLVKNLPELRVRANLLLGKTRPSLVANRAERHVLQAMAGGTDLCIDLQSSLKLHLVVRSKGTFERKLEVLHMACPSSGNGRGGEPEGCNRGKRELADHVRQSFHSAATLLVDAPPSGG